MDTVHFEKRSVSHACHLVPDSETVTLVLAAVMVTQHFEIRPVSAWYGVWCRPFPEKNPVWNKKSDWFVLQFFHNKKYIAYAIVCFSGHPIANSTQLQDHWEVINQ